MIPVGRRVVARDAAFSGREVRRDPAPDNGLVDDCAAAEILSMAALATDAAFDQVFAALLGAY